MRTVHEVSELAHVSVRTLHHYDKIGLLRPSARSEAGYRLYGDKDLARLRQIMLFRELEFSLTDIGAILDSPEFDRDKALDQQIELLELRRERIGNLIDMAKAMRGGGESALEFGPFDTSKLDEYAEQAKASWGKTPQWKEYEEKWAGRSKGEQVAMGRSLMELFVPFGRMSAEGADPSCEEALNQVARIQAFITENYYDCPGGAGPGIWQRRRLHAEHQRGGRSRCRRVCRCRSARVLRPSVGCERPVRQRLAGRQQADVLLDVRHGGAPQLVLQCPLGGLKPAVQRGVNVAAHGALRTGALVKVEERVRVTLVYGAPQVEEGDLLERPCERDAGLALGGAYDARLLEHAHEHADHDGARADAFCEEGAGAGLSTAAGFFVEDAGWHAAARRYDDFLHQHRHDRIVLLEVGVGGNTPGIIKYPFWRMAAQNRHAIYVQLNRGEVLAPSQLERQSVIQDCDAAEALSAVRERLG